MDKAVDTLYIRTAYVKTNQLLPGNRVTETVMYNEQKAAQIAAWFLAQEGGSMPHLKLIKLMYLAERASLKAHGYLLTGDQLVSMPHGPVLSSTLNHINDEAFASQSNGWDSWISDKANHTVGLLRAADRDALDEISDADIVILDEVWRLFGWMTKYQIRNYTHSKTNCPEWEDPSGSSLPIRYADVLEAVGLSSDAAEDAERRIRESSRVSRTLAS